MAFYTGTLSPFGFPHTVSTDGSWTSYRDIDQFFKPRTLVAVGAWVADVHDFAAGPCSAVGKKKKKKGTFVTFKNCSSKRNKTVPLNNCVGAPAENAFVYNSVAKKNEPKWYRVGDRNADSIELFPVVEASNVDGEVEASNDAETNVVAEAPVDAITDDEAEASVAAETNVEAEASVDTDDEADGGSGDESHESDVADSAEAQVDGEVEPSPPADDEASEAGMYICAHIHMRTCLVVNRSYMHIQYTYANLSIYAHKIHICELVHICVFCRWRRCTNRPDGAAPRCAECRQSRKIYYVLVGPPTGPK